MTMYNGVFLYSQSYSIVDKLKGRLNFNNPATITLRGFVFPQARLELPVWPSDLFIV
ncbi:MAG: hypothetical protein ACXWAA_08225 [Methylobacter sp.]